MNFFLACLLPADQGPCKGRMLRYYYNNAPGIKDCIGFVYGGCRGNANNFESAEQCVQQCRSRIELTVTKAPSNIKEKLNEKKIPGCNSEFGCCDDHVTPAKSPDLAGCPGNVSKKFSQQSYSLIMHAPLPPRDDFNARNRLHKK